MNRYPNESAARFDQQFEETPEEKFERFRKRRKAAALATCDAKPKDAPQPSAAIDGADKGGAE